MIPLPKIWIIATGWNCEKYARKCVMSVMKQKYAGEFHLIVINDASTDLTEKELRNLFYPNISIFHYGQNLGAAFRRWQVMNDPKIDDEDVFLLLGLDDELLDGALEKIGEQYKKGMWMTYGNWMNQKGVICQVNLEFNDYDHYHKLYRNVLYRSTAPNTFKKKLIKKLREDDFQIDGKWVMTCTETNLMYCCMEMCGKSRIGIIFQPIYLYNEKRSDGSILRFGREFKHQVHENFKNRHPKQTYENF